MPEMNLLACEDLALRYELHRTLGSRGARSVRTVRSGWGFVLAAREMTPALMLLDHWLPDLLGDEVMEQVRRQPSLRDTPIILVAPGIGDEARARCTRLGPVRLFAAPPRQEEMSAEIQSQLGLALRRQRRIAVRIPLGITLRGQHVEALTSDLSDFGVAFEAGHPFSIGERVELELLRGAGGPIRCWATIRHVDSSRGLQVVGSEFDAPTPELKAAIALLLRDGRQLGKALEGLERLPTLAAVATRVLEESTREDPDLQVLISLVRTDPALTACLIKLANSPAHYFVSPVTTVERAATLLGINAVCNAVLAVSILRVVSHDARGKLAQALWRHSVASAVAAELLAPRFDVPKGESFTLGLLHDVGKFVLHFGLPAPASDEPPSEHQAALTPAEEHERFGMDHAEVGATLLARWRIPAGLHQAVRWHHGEVPTDATPQQQRAIGLVRAADALAHRCHLGLFAVPDNDALASRVHPGEIEELCARVYRGVASLSGLFGAAIEPSELCAEVVERANQRLATELREAHERHELVRRAYERTRQQLTSLVQSEKYHALGRITAGIAHEINNPLSCVSANLEALARYVVDLSAAATGKPVGGESPLEEIVADLPSLLSETRDGVRRVAAVVAALHHFDPATPTDVGQDTPRKCLEEAVALATPLRPAGVAVEVHAGAERDVVIDTGGLVRAFVEIMLNAFAAMPHGGRLEIHLRDEPGTISVLFRDEGEGISEENLKHLFEPFFTTRPVGSGRGLGLSVAYGIVSRLRGQILISSIPAAGTTVEVRLPVPTRSQ